jgi:hypothetical protein
MNIDKDAHISIRRAWHDAGQEYLEPAESGLFLGIDKKRNIFRVRTKKGDIRYALDDVLGVFEARPGMWAIRVRKKRAAPSTSRKRRTRLR